jgi:hypothetical protein
MPLSLITSLVILALTGIAVGFGQGFLGVGGSFIMVPVVYWLFTAVMFYVAVRMVGVFKWLGLPL